MENFSLLESFYNEIDEMKTIPYSLPEPEAGSALSRKARTGPAASVPKQTKYGFITKDRKYLSPTKHLMQLLNLAGVEFKKSGPAELEIQIDDSSRVRIKVLERL